MEDPDGEEDGEDEDGGTLAPIDGPSASGARATLTAEGVLRDAPAGRSFWKDLKNRFKGLLVVRKDNGVAVSLPEEELARLFELGFPLPIEQFPVEKLRDSFLASRGKHRRHHAIDLPAPRHTPVVAVVDGTIERLGRDRRGGIVCYQRDESGKLLFYYAHLNRHAPGLKVGDRVKKGQELGEVGATGRASGPHLHFAVFQVEGESNPKKGLAVNPYIIFSAFLPR